MVYPTFVIDILPDLKDGDSRLMAFDAPNGRQDDNCRANPSGFNFKHGTTHKFLVTMVSKPLRELANSIHVNPWNRIL
jgi:hypothetical protein